MSDIMKKQIGGQHYKKHKIQPWNVIDEYELNFYEGNALKYILRNKGDRIEDLQKAIHYIEKCIADLQTEEKEAPKDVDPAVGYSEDPLAKFPLNMRK